MAYQVYYTLLPILIGGIIYLFTRRFTDGNLYGRIQISYRSLSLDTIPTIHITAALINSITMGLRSGHAIKSISPSAANIASAVKHRFSIDGRLISVTDELIGLKMCSDRRDRPMDYLYDRALNTGEFKLSHGMFAKEFLTRNKILIYGCSRNHALPSAVLSDAPLSIMCDESQIPQLKRVLFACSARAFPILTAVLIGKLRVITSR